MDALRELLALFSIDVDDKKLKEADKEVEGFSKKLEEVGEKLKKAGKILAEAFGVEKFAEFVEKNLEANAHLKDLSNRLDLAVGELRAFSLVAQGAGVDLDGAANSLGLLQKNMGEAARKGGETAAAFARLKVETKNADGSARPLREVLLDIADGMKELPDQNQRAAAAMALFGRQGRALLPVLMQGREGLEEALKEAEALGNGLGEGFYDRVKKAQEAFEGFSFGLQSLKDRGLDAILPAITKLGQILEGTVEKVLELDKHTHILQTGMTVLAGIIGVMLVHALASVWALIGPLLLELAAAFGPAILAATALTYVIQDLWNLVTGGTSVIGNLIEKFSGLEGKKKVVAELRELFNATKEAINGVAYTVGYLIGVLAGLGQALLSANGGEVQRFFLRLLDYVIGATRGLIGFIRVLEKIPTAIRDHSFDSINKVIDQTGNAIFGKGGPLEDASLAGASSDVRAYGVPQANVDEWNRHHGAGAPTVEQGERLGKVTKTANPLITSRPILPARTARVPSSVRHGDRSVTMDVTNHIDVHTTSDQPKVVGDAVGAGVASSSQRQLNAALNAVVKP